MWHWDQGRLEYYQFDALRKIASFVTQNDFRKATREQLVEATGLPFSAPPTYLPWRNYSRVLKIALLIYNSGEKAIATPVATSLASPGAVTADEYFHFLARSFTEPSPALKGWPGTEYRYPLLFTLKYLLAKCASGIREGTSLDEVIGAFAFSGFRGDEDDTAYIDLINKKTEFATSIKHVDKNSMRQAKESIRVISQISYLTTSDKNVYVSLHQQDAMDIFNDLFEVNGDRKGNGDEEILRLASLFESEYDEEEYEYPNTTLEETTESGFLEGGKVQKTHITIERNAELRRKFFEKNNTATCDFCGINTKTKYPWVDNVIDLHHLLPLASGTRVVASGTVFDDIRAICPTCHRAVHKYYSLWLKKQNRKDFESREEALSVYQAAKNAETNRD